MPFDGALAAALVGVARVVGEGEATAGPGTQGHVEDRVDVAALHVGPYRPDRADVRGRRRARRDEAEVVGEVDVVRLAQQVVDHVVEDPDVARLVGQAVAGRQPHRRLLLAGGEEDPPAEREPDAVVEMEHIHPRNRVVRLPPQVGLDRGDVAVLGRLLHERREGDPVLARVDVERPGAVLQVLDAGDSGARSGGNGTPSRTSPAFSRRLPAATSCTSCRK